MKRRYDRSFVPGMRLVLGVAAVAVAGCARQPAFTEPVETAEAPAQVPIETLVETAPAERAETGKPLDVREIRVVEDNGQQGIFVKLTRPVASTKHFTLDHPSRLIIDLDGPGGEPSRAEKFPVENPMISAIRVGTTEGRLRLTVELKSGAVPPYNVDALNDALVAFIGEPSGRREAPRERVVFSRGGQPPAMAAAPAVPPARGGAETEARGEAGQSKVYGGQRVSLDFKDADVHNVLRLLAEVSKLNIVATDDVKGKVTLKLFDVPWDQALDIVLQVLNLESVHEGNVVRISTVSRLRQEREELQKAQEAAKAIEPLRVEYIRVNYAKAAKLSELISGAQTQLQQRGFGGRRATEEGEEGVLSSRGSVLVDEYTNTLVVRDIQRGIDNARELVRRLDVQTPQVLIESNIVEATTDFARALGVQWGYRGNYSPATGNPTGANFPGSILAGGSGLGTGSGGVPFLVDFPAKGNFAPGAGTALDLMLGSVDGSQALNARLSALEEQGKGKVISRPRVVTLNNVPATIKSLTIIRVKLPSTGTVINTGAGGAAGGQSVATEKIETGIVLTVTPLVSSDGFVMLDLQAKSSQADFSRQVDSIPTEVSREANSHILVKDGQTVVLGGIYRDTSTEQQAGVPFLRDVPGLNWLFRNMSRTQRREDLLVFLTPRIVGGPRAGLPSADDLWKHRGGGDS